MSDHETGVPLSFDDADRCAECPHDLTVHSAPLGCWLCDCTYGRPRPGDDGQGHARYLRAWFIFVGPDGELSTDPGATQVMVGATTARRVRVIVPDGLDVAPAVADRIAERVAEAARVARDPGARFAPGASEAS